jgi:hypothetical protein
MPAYTSISGGGGKRALEQSCVAALMMRHPVSCKMLRLFAFACTLVLVLGVPVLQQPGAVVVMHVFSATADPSWTLSPSQLDELRSSIPSVECSASLRYPNVGYQGFTINGNKVKGCPQLERVLLSTCPISLKPQVIAYVTSQLHDISAASANTHLSPSSIDSFLQPSARAPRPVAPSLPVRGPDTVPVYDPKNDVQGHFISHQTENNCYNYANDVATDSFAQPGRGSGQKWSFDTCADINASAVRDGLQWVGETMPTAPPAVGHHVVRATTACSVLPCVTLLRTGPMDVAGHELSLVSPRHQRAVVAQTRTDAHQGRGQRRQTHHRPCQGMRLQLPLSHGP